MREVKLSLYKLFKRYPLTCKLKFNLSISALFLTFSLRRLKVWWSSDLLCNQRERGVEPLGTKFRNTLFILLVPLSNRWRFIFNVLLSIFISFPISLSGSVACALLLTPKISAIIIIFRIKPQKITLILNYIVLKNICKFPVLPNLQFGSREYKHLQCEKIKKV